MQVQKNRTKAVNKIISFFPAQLEALDHLVVDRGMASVSEAVRQAVLFYHDKLYPNYVYNAFSPKTQEERGKVREEKLRDAIPDREFVAQTLQGAVLPTRDGGWVVALHNIGNDVLIVPLNQIKQWYDTDEMGVNIHLKAVKSKPVKALLENKAIRRRLEKEYGVVFKDGGEA